METLDNKTVKTRKAHQCWGCAEVFPKGTKMGYVTSVDSGEFSHAYWCDTCGNIISNMTYWETEDGFNLGELKEEYPEMFEQETTQER